MRVNPKHTTNLFYIALFMWSFFQAAFLESEASTAFGSGVYLLYGVAWNLAKCLLLAKIFLEVVCTRFHAQTCVKVVLIAALGAVSVFHAQSSFLEPLFWFVAAGKNCKVDKIIKTLLIAQLSAIALILALCLLGFIPIEATQFRDDGTPRYSLGFIHPNIFATRVLQCMMLFVAVQKEKLKFFHCVVGILTCVVVDFITDSRTSCYLGLLLWVIVLYYLYAISDKKYSQAILRFFAAKAKYMVVLMSMLCIYLALFHSTNDSFSSRIIQAHVYLSYYGITIWGQPLAIYKNDIEMLMQTKLYTLDMAYMYLLLGFGVVGFVGFIYTYYKMFQVYSTKKEYIFVAVMFIYVLMGFMETSLIRTTYNFSQLFVIPLFWNAQFRLKKIKMKC